MASPSSLSGWHWDFLGMQTLRPDGDSRLGGSNDQPSPSILAEGLPVSFTYLSATGSQLDKERWIRLIRKVGAMMAVGPTLPEGFPFRPSRKQGTFL